MNYATQGEGKAMSLFPMFLKLEGRSCLVVGAGKIGESKIRSLLAAHATVRVVAPSATSAVSQWVRAGIVTWAAREFDLSDLNATFLVVAATSTIEVNDRVYREAQRRQILCNVVYYPAVVRRGALQVAISTAGKSPALAQRLRREFERWLAPVYAGWLEELGRARAELFRTPLQAEHRRHLLHQLASGEAFLTRHGSETNQEAHHER